MTQFAVRMVEEEEIMGKSDPLLLLDNGTLSYILGNGEYRFTNLNLMRPKQSLR